MKIADVKLYVLEDPESKTRGLRLKPVPNLRRTQYTHGGGSGPERPERQHIIEVVTEDGIVGRCTTTMRTDQVYFLKEHVIGESAFERERFYQMFHKGTRWLYQNPGWFGDFDNCLWDIAGKAAGLPVNALVGRARQCLPVYLTGGDMDVEGYLNHVEQGREMGIEAYKFHTYKGGKADIPIYRTVREALGADYVLITDPVCSYDLREAIEVGRVLQELDFVWLEEPMHEQRISLYQELCNELDIPVMGTEMLMHDIDLTAQWLIQGATDRLRGNARHGTTQVLKLAHLAELHGTNVELNGQGGNFGLVHAHLGCCIDNTDYYEYFGAGADASRKQGEKWGMYGAPLIEDGHIAPPDGPGWGAEWDEERLQVLVVETH